MYCLLINKIFSALRNHINDLLRRTPQTALSTICASIGQELDLTLTDFDTHRSHMVLKHCSLLEKHGLTTYDAGVLSEFPHTDVVFARVTDDLPNPALNSVSPPDLPSIVMSNDDLPRLSWEVYGQDDLYGMEQVLFTAQYEENLDSTPLFGTSDLAVNDILSISTPTLDSQTGTPTNDIASSNGHENHSGSPSSGMSNSKSDSAISRNAVSIRHEESEMSRSQSSTEIDRVRQMRLSDTIETDQVFGSKFNDPAESQCASATNEDSNDVDLLKRRYKSIKIQMQNQCQLIASRLKKFR